MSFILYFILAVLLPIQYQSLSSLTTSEAQMVTDQKILMRSMLILNSEQIQQWEHSFELIMKDFILRFKKSHAYLALLSQLKEYEAYDANNKQLVRAYLLYKMLYGDPITERLFSDIITSEQDTNRKDEDWLIAGVNALSITGGISVFHFSQYQAYSYLKDNPFTDRTDYEGIIPIVSVEVRDSPTSSWKNIQYYEHSRNPLNPEGVAKLHWNYFPLIESYLNHTNNCDITPKGGILNIFPNKESLVSLSECAIQVIGPSTHVNYIKQELVLSNYKELYRTYIWIPVRTDASLYNCASFTVGFGDYLGNQYWTKNGKREDITTVRELKYFLKQIAYALSFASHNEKYHALTMLLIDEKIPTRIMPLLVQDLNYLDTKIGYFGSEPNEEMIKNACGTLDNSVLFYGSNGISSHLALFDNELSSWVSKLCEGHLIIHRFNDLNCPNAFGKPRFFYCPMLKSEFRAKDTDHF